jgi:DNA-binding IscR family transcriptional regulator
VIEAVDGPLLLNLCVPDAAGCEQGLECAVQPVWAEARDALTKVLTRATMAKLGRACNAAQRRCSTEIATGAATAKLEVLS